MTGKEEYQLGIQRAVFETLRNSRMAGIPYLKKKEIISGVKDILPELTEPDNKVSQALYHLSRETKFRRKKIEKVREENKAKGWTVLDEYLDENDVVF